MLPAIVRITHRRVGYRSPHSILVLPADSLCRELYIGCEVVRLARRGNLKLFRDGIRTSSSVGHAASCAAGRGIAQKLDGVATGRHRYRVADDVPLAVKENGPQRVVLGIVVHIYEIVIDRKSTRLNSSHLGIS